MPIDDDVLGYNVGDEVRKVGGDYSFCGEVRGIVVKKSGQKRYVVEDDRGLLFIFNSQQLALR